MTTNKKYDITPKVVDITEKEKGKISIQCDIWLAIDIKTGEIVGVYIGSRDTKGPQGLWYSLLPFYNDFIRQFYTSLLSGGLPQS
ncbi:hypothetical protein QUF74_04400 [Candidatus Halobeggiatoa sp. HSG11]|nr:hypothetical protein [Candidatus Halobeggiatoa sp. HSG11]